MTTTQHAPLLTPECFIERSYTYESPGEWTPTVTVKFPVTRCDADSWQWNSRDALAAALQALADGRTRCIQPLSEEEQRTAFYEFIDDWMRVNKSYPSGIDCWLACARAMGAIR